ncbi:hypothetical protein DL765_011095 [Monosporascus sp. GIB2]|nr:hypothetical protein DL765_011095 [Monosporascus sp. GIB2]
MGSLTFRHSIMVHSYRLKMRSQITNHHKLYFNVLAASSLAMGERRSPAHRGKARRYPRHHPGADHTIALPLLRSINRGYGPVSVIHFDIHLDTWRPRSSAARHQRRPASTTGRTSTMRRARACSPTTATLHASIRTTLSGPSGLEHDEYCGFEITEARETDGIRAAGTIK